MVQDHRVLFAARRRGGVGQVGHLQQLFLERGLHLLELDLERLDLVAHRRAWPRSCAVASCLSRLARAISSLTVLRRLRFSSTATSSSRRVRSSSSSCQGPLRRVAPRRRRASRTRSGSLRISLMSSIEAPVGRRTGPRAAVGPQRAARPAHRVAPQDGQPRELAAEAAKSVGYRAVVDLALHVDEEDVVAQPPLGRPRLDLGEVDVPERELLQDQQQRSRLVFGDLADHRGLVRARTSPAARAAWPGRRSGSRCPRGPRCRPRGPRSRTLSAAAVPMAAQGSVRLATRLHRAGGGVGGLDSRPGRLLAQPVRHCALACGWETTLVICSSVTPGRAIRRWRTGMPHLAHDLKVVDLVGQDVHGGRHRALDGVLDGDDGAVHVARRHGLDGVRHGGEGDESGAAGPSRRLLVEGGAQRFLGEGARGPRKPMVAAATGRGSSGMMSASDEARWPAASQAHRDRSSLGRRRRDPVVFAGLRRRLALGPSWSAGAAREAARPAVASRAHPSPRPTDDLCLDRRQPLTLRLRFSRSSSRSSWGRSPGSPAPSSSWRAEGSVLAASGSSARCAVHARPDRERRRCRAPGPGPRSPRGPAGCPAAPSSEELDVHAREIAADHGGDDHAVS